MDSIIKLEGAAAEHPAWVGGVIIPRNPFATTVLDGVGGGRGWGLGMSNASRLAFRVLRFSVLR